MKILFVPFALSVLFLIPADPPPSQPKANFVAYPLIELNDNGAWSWFMNERAIVHDGKLIVGSVRSLGKFGPTKNDPNWGNVEISVYDIAKGTTNKTTLHQHYEQDDHDSPALLVLP